LKRESTDLTGVEKEGVALMVVADGSWGMENSTAAGGVQTSPVKKLAVGDTAVVVVVVGFGCSQSGSNPL